MSLALSRAQSSNGQVALKCQPVHLQNIPIRTERGRQIRKAFIPRNNDYILLSADYSQIELRIVASISEDPNMCDAFQKGKDIHTATAAKVFGVPLETVNKMIKFMGRDGLARLNGGEEVREKFGIDHRTWRLMLGLAQALKGFPRHLGIHTGGFLITQDPINQMVPVEKASMNGRYVIQWNKDDADFLKLMKIDLLSLGMLSALRKCFTLLKAHKNKDWNLATLPRDDVATYDMCCKNG